MISPRLARRIATIHKWLGLIVAAQLLVWTTTGLFMASFHLVQVRGDALVHPASHAAPMNMAKVKLSSTEALKSVVEDRPLQLTLRPLAGEPVYEINSELGVFLVSAETGELMSPVSEELAKKIATSAWAGTGALKSMELIATPPREAGLSGQAWAAHFEGEGNPTLWISANNGQVAPPRTDLWRIYDFFYGLHLMDWVDHENANQPWTIALAILALSTVLFGIALLVHRFTRGLIKKDETQ